MTDWEDELGPLPRKDKEIPSPQWFIDKNRDQVGLTGDWFASLMSEAPNHHDEPEPAEEPEMGEYAHYGLSEDEKTVLDATVMAGLSVRQAADQLPWSPSTVWRLHTSALERIKQWWENHEYELKELNNEDTDNVG